MMTSTVQPNAVFDHRPTGPEGIRYGFVRVGCTIGLDEDTAELWQANWDSGSLKVGGNPE